MTMMFQVGIVLVALVGVLYCHPQGGSFDYPQSVTLNGGGIQRYPAPDSSLHLDNQNPGRPLKPEPYGERYRRDAPLFQTIPAKLSDVPTDGSQQEIPKIHTLPARLPGEPRYRRDTDEPILAVPIPQPLPNIEKQPRNE